MVLVNDFMPANAKPDLLLGSFSKRSKSHPSFRLFHFKMLLSIGKEKIATCLTSSYLGISIAFQTLSPLLNTLPEFVKQYVH